MRVMVTGGTGTVGSEVTRELLARGVEVHVLTRGGGKVLPSGAHEVVGDLATPATVRTAFAGMDGVFLLNAVGKTEAHEGLMGVNGIRAGGVRRLVYMSVHHVDAAPHLPHFGAKIPIELAVAASGIPFTILRPNNFYQNDVWYREAMLQYGVYPQPLGNAGVSRVDVRDIAEAAAIALTRTGHAGETYDLVGPQALTGADCAATWSRALGREVRYAGDDLDAWEQQNLRYLPDWMVYDFKLMYEQFQRQGLRASEQAIARQTALLGHPPRPFDAFVGETAAAWGIEAPLPG